jgi:hypothetical protein
MRLLVLVAVAFALLASACAGEAAPDGAGEVRDLWGYPVFRDEASGILVIFGTPDLGVGTHRVAFVMQDDEDLVRLPVLDVESFFHAEGARADSTGPVESARARFYEFPFGSRGLYSATLTFDRPGTWRVEALVPRPDGTVPRIAFTFPVPERPLAPDVGDLAPPSINRTLTDVGSIAELTTGAEPDPALYQKTVAQTLDEGRPFVLVFASPAFCTNALCGPQVEMLTEIREDYEERLDFIHIDIYENPHEIRGDLSRAVRSPILQEWGIETDEWTFVVGSDGRVAARFEAFAPRVELEAALQGALEADLAGAER